MMGIFSVYCIQANLCYYLTVYNENSIIGVFRSTMQYYVYIMASKTRVIYTGMTNDLERRVYVHKHGLLPGFSRKYRCKRLVFFEDSPDVNAAIQREKQIKDWNRGKKVALIESMNPQWDDLCLDWFEDNINPMSDVSK